MSCEKIINELKELENEYLDFLEEVANAESPTSDKEGVDKAGNCFFNKAKELGFLCEKVKEEKAGDLVFITMNENQKSSPIIFSGHIDTVHPKGLFGDTPVQREGNIMKGPGVTDCKGGVVAALMAMHALKNLGFTDRKIMLLIQTDEETNSRTSDSHTINTICEKSKGAVGFINLEGALDGNVAVLIRKGIIKFKFEITGISAHASKCFIGANSIAEAAHKIIELEKYKDKDGITCNCGVINGGSVINVVPYKCEFLVDTRFQTEDEEKTIRKVVNEIAEKVYIEGCTTKVTETSYRPSMPYTERNKEFLDLINKIYRENNMPELSAGKITGGSDAAYITRCNIPCIDNIGVKGDKIHSKDEYMKMESLLESAARMAVVAFNI